MLQFACTLPNTLSPACQALAPTAQTMRTAHTFDNRFARAPFIRVLAQKFREYVKQVIELYGEIQLRLAA